MPKAQRISNIFQRLVFFKEAISKYDQEQEYTFFPPFPFKSWHSLFVTGLSPTAGQ